MLLVYVTVDLFGWNLYRTLMASNGSRRNVQLTMQYSKIDDIILLLQHQA
jgi:hypothetical protein